MNVLNKQLHLQMPSRLSAPSPPTTRSHATHQPVDTFTPSGLEAAQAGTSPKKIKFAQISLVGLGMLGALAGSVHAASSLEAPQQKAIETVTQQTPSQAAELDLSRLPEPTESTVQKEPEVAFGQTLSSEQKEAVGQMVTDLAEDGFQVQADDVINFMATETGGTFDPSIRSGGKKGGAVGLAQFTQTAINQMNRSREKDDQLTKKKLEQMDFTEQSKVVTEYLSATLSDRGMEGKTVSASDLYSAVFAPAAVGKPMTATVYSRSHSPKYYKANKSLDTNRDGKISKSELTARLNVWAERGEDLRG